MKNIIILIMVFLVFFSISSNFVSAGIISDTFLNLINDITSSSSSSSTTTTQNTGSGIKYINDAKEDVSIAFKPDFYGLRFYSEYYFSQNVGKFNDTSYKVSFTVDLNNVKLISYKEQADSNKVRFKYYFNNYVRSSTSDLTKIFSSSTNDIDVYANDYFGLPFYITSCYLDCDTNDNIPASTWNSNKYSGDIWYMEISSYSGASSEWINSRLPYDNQLYDKSHMLRFSKDNYQCNYDTIGVKNIAFGCILTKNDIYRHESQTDKSWSFNEINSNFNIVDESAKTMVVRGSYEVDLSTSQYSAGISDIETTNETTSDTQTNAIPEDSTGLSIQRQEELIQMKKLNALNMEWMNSLLDIVSFIFGANIIFYYMISLSAFFFLVFVSIPFINKKMKESIEKLTKW